MPERKLELRVSWFLAWYLNHCTKLALWTACSIWNTSVPWNSRFWCIKFFLRQWDGQCLKLQFSFEYNVHLHSVFSVFSWSILNFRMIFQFLGAIPMSQQSQCSSLLLCLTCHLLAKCRSHGNYDSESNLLAFLQGVHEKAAVSLVHS